MVRFRDVRDCNPSIMPTALRIAPSNKEDEEQWDHVNGIGKVGRAIRARLEFDHPSNLDGSTESVIAFVFEFLGSPIHVGMQFSEFLNSAPAGDPNTDSDSRKRWSRARSGKTGAMLAFCPA